MTVSRHLLQAELEKEAYKKNLRQHLPHKYGWKWYRWAKAFYESKSRVNLLVAGNQLSKSSTQIRKCIEWATNKKLWPQLWKSTPLQFWYLYPSKDVATIEFEKKWVPEFLPSGEFKDSEEFGWEAEYRDKHIYCIRFKSGVTLYFKTYKQDVHLLQTSTVWAIFCDEELPVDLYDELQFRLAATEGYFHMVFTATLGQLFWKQAMEGVGATEELPDAFKMQISLYDCLVYEDGTPSGWTPERIEQLKKSCRNRNEVARRVFGKFVSESGLKCEEFVYDRHMIKPFDLEEGKYFYFSAVDPGGGGTGHPAAMTFIAVTTDLKKAYVYAGCRMDGVLTASGDILEKWRELKGNKRLTLSAYDYNAKDFEIVSSRQGEGFIKANKAQEFGADMINDLFKNDMLFIFDTEELRPLAGELMTLQKVTPKRNAKDDFYDALRYTVTIIPFDWESLLKTTQIEQRPEVTIICSEKEELIRQINERRGDRKKISETNQPEGWEDVESDINYWNKEYGN